MKFYKRIPFRTSRTILISFTSLFSGSLMRITRLVGFESESSFTGDLTDDLTRTCISSLDPDRRLSEYFRSFFWSNLSIDALCRRRLISLGILADISALIRRSANVKLFFLPTCGTSIYFYYRKIIMEFIWVRSVRSFLYLDKIPIFHRFCTSATLLRPL